MRIVFRVDASFKIGSGHVMRCLTLAQACRDDGAEVLFLCRRQPGNMVELVKGLGFEVGELDLPEGKLDQSADAAQAAKAIEKISAAVDWLIVDHYEISAQWEEAVRSCARRIMVIDDLANRRHDCDLLLDQNYRQSHDGRYAPHVDGSCHLLMGPEYALLQNVYAAERRRVQTRSRVEKVLLYFGGADNAGATVKALRAVLALGNPNLAIDVVLPLNTPAISDIQSVAVGQASVTLHQSLPSLAPLIGAADLAIGALGATSWERLCLGLPTIGVTTASNQLEVAAALNAAGLAIWLGNVEDVTENMITESIVDVQNRHDLAHWSGQCMDICDGLGAQRIVTVLGQVLGDGYQKS